MNWPTQHEAESNFFQAEGNFIENTIILFIVNGRIRKKLLGTVTLFLKSCQI